MTVDSLDRQAPTDPLAYLERSQGELSDAVARKNLADKLDEFGSKWEASKAVLANLKALAAHGHELRDVPSSAVGEARDAVSKIAEYGQDMEKAASRDALVRLIGDFEDWLRGPKRPSSPAHKAGLRRPRPDRTGAAGSGGSRAHPDQRGIRPRRGVECPRGPSARRLVNPPYGIAPENSGTAGRSLRPSGRVRSRRRHAGR